LDARIPARLSPGEARRFTLSVGPAFLLLAAFLGWRGHAAVALGLASVASTFIVAGLVAPHRIDRIYRAWMGLAMALSKVTAPIVLGAFYLMVLTPVGVLRRTLGSDPITRPLSNGSYWVRRDPGHTRSRLERQF
jgi:hypothetical protein